MGVGGQGDLQECILLEILSLPPINLQDNVQFVKRKYLSKERKLTEKCIRTLMFKLSVVHIIQATQCLNSGFLTVEWTGYTVNNCKLLICLKDSFITWGREKRPHTILYMANRKVMHQEENLTPHLLILNLLPFLIPPHFVSPLPYPVRLHSAV